LSLFRYALGIGDIELISNGTAKINIIGCNYFCEDIENTGEKNKDVVHMVVIEGVNGI